MNIHIKSKVLLTSCLALLSATAWGQDRVGITGKVVDSQGEALPGVSVTVDGMTVSTITNDEGIYNLSVPQGSAVRFTFVGYENQKVDVIEDENTYNITMAEAYYDKFADEKIQTGAYKTFSRSESTAAVSIIGNEDIDKRSSKNIANSILGKGNGLISLDGLGTYFDNNATMYVRGLHTLNGNNGTLVLVDGIERVYSTISPQEVESVSILKDAAAVALYGFKGVNNVIYIKTKRGQAAKEKSIKVTYDHLFNTMVDKPEFIDAPTFARARNEALTNEGSTVMQYSDNDIAAFESGNYPYYFPNVDWVEETFREMGHTNRYGIEFNGGGEKFRYYTAINLLNDQGFINEADYNAGYDTQDVYTRANLRNNLDVKVSDYTHLQINVSGVLSEMQQPGSAADIWDLVYTVPAAAFPVMNEKGEWGGNATWAGTNNPVAQARGAAYYKIHERSLYADVQIDQSLSMFVKGLGFSARMGYDNYSTLYEDHSKTFVYGQTATSWDASGNIVEGAYFAGGEDGEMGQGANTQAWNRRVTINAGLTFDRWLNDNNYIYTQLKWDYDYENTTGVNTSITRQNFSWYAHYGLMNRYYLDAAMVGSGSSRLAPGHKWAFSPTVSAAWVISNEDFLRGSDIVNFLKLRASYGIINADWVPGGDWTYYTQNYVQDGVIYPFDSTFQSTGNGRTYISRMATENLTTEKAHKLNIGIDATLFEGLNVELDYYAQNNKDVWVDGSGVYTALIGFGAPYTYEGEVKTNGFEAAVNYTRTIGDLTFNLGGSFTKMSSEIVAMGEEPRAYANLVRTGDPLNSVYGLIAEGLFKDQAEIDASPTQAFSTVLPGDIKYKDVNGDGVVNSNDVCKIGHSTDAPEIYYNFRLGAEWKGIGINADFQGTANYTAIKNTSGYYWGLIGNTPLAQEVYDNRWTPSNTNALYPRLSSSSNANNYQTSTFWTTDRSYLQLRNVEMYYKFPQSLLGNTFIDQAKIYVRGVDLFSIDNIAYTSSSAHGTAAPLNRSVVVGCNLTF